MNIPSSGTVILIHGLTGTPREVGELQQHFEQRGWQAVVPALSAHARIEDLKLCTLETWVADAEAAFNAALARQRPPLACVGLSLGSLLGLLLAIRHPEITALVMLSPTGKLRNWRTNLVLKALSFFPDALLNELGVIAKRPRPAALFHKPREALPSHSIAALARLFKLRRSVLENGEKATLPILLMQDSNDHYLDPHGVKAYEAVLPRLTVEWVNGGEHELTIGPHHQYVTERAFTFIAEHAHAT